MSLFRCLVSPGLTLCFVFGGSCTATLAWQSEAKTQGQPAQDVSIQKREPTAFMRVATDEYGAPTALQTATSKYVLKDEAGQVKLEVFLESVIHIADASYYREFNKRLARYDCVLYELIAAKDAKPGQEGSDQDPTTSSGASSAEERPEASADSRIRFGLQMLQQLSTSSLGLTYQVEEIDYGQENFVHSDLSPSEMAERMRDRGQSQASMLADMLIHLTEHVKDEVAEAQAAAQVEGQPARETFDFSILTDPEGTAKIRRLLATTFGDSRDLDSALPASIHQLLIGDRNQRALQVFQQELDKGKRRIAFFWGAGHMADFEQRLIMDYGLEPESVNWRSAWDLRDGAVPGAPLEGLIESAFRDSFKEKLRQLIERKDDRAKDDGGPDGHVPR